MIAPSGTSAIISKKARPPIRVKSALFNCRAATPGDNRASLMMMEIVANPWFNRKTIPITRLLTDN
jgi:hypothetical protein